MFKRWRQRRREENALVRIVGGMQAEDALVLDDLARQVEEKLSALPPAEQLKVIQVLKGGLRGTNSEQ